MLVFICDHWYKVREIPGDNLLCFVSFIEPKRERYFSLWAGESESNESMATKSLPFSGHQNGLYEGCTMVNFHPDGPPHSQLIRYKNKIIQTIS